MNKTTTQGQTNKLSPSDVRSNLGFITHMHSQLLEYKHPAKAQTVPQTPQNAPQAPVAQKVEKGDDKEDKALVDTEIEAKIGDLRTEIMDTIKTEIGGVRQAITDALKEESSNDKN